MDEVEKKTGWEFEMVLTTWVIIPTIVYTTQKYNKKRHWGFGLYWFCFGVEYDTMNKI